VNPTASAVEKLIAALFEGSSVAQSARELDALWRSGHSGVTSEQVIKSCSGIKTHMALPVRRAITPDPRRLSDIRLELHDGEILHLEVKAQTFLGFNDLGNADWVRDGTDLLRYLFYNDAAFKASLPGWMQSKLNVGNPAPYFGAWTCGELWAADVALLKDRERRERAGVFDGAGLESFMSKKALLHVTKEGSQVCHLVDVAGVRDVLSGCQLQYELNTQLRASSVGVYVGGSQDRGPFDFAYYVAYRKSHVGGRHKLQSRALQSGSATRFLH
jgi:hypothetical protein